METTSQIKGKETRNNWQYLKKPLLLSFKKIHKTHNTPNVTRASAQLISVTE